jgi:hypothetical protein
LSHSDFNFRFFFQGRSDSDSTTHDSATTHDSTTTHATTTSHTTTSSLDPDFCFTCEISGNGKCINNGTECDCLDGFTGLSCSGT